MTHSLDELALAQLARLERRRLRRQLTVTERLPVAHALRATEQLVSFACNDYLGLSHHPEVVQAALGATRRYGTGAGASRLVTGNHPLYDGLEARLAALKDTEDAVVFGSGYLASVGTLSAIAGPPDLILLDELCHSCLYAGAALSGARTLKFRHNDAGGARALLERERAAHRRCLVVTEGVFSMDGDLAPLPQLAAAAEAHDAWLATDDAHALGVIGDGRGSSHAHGQRVAVPLQIGTLSKAAGGYGGYLCASRPVADLIRNPAHSFVYSTGLPPGVVAAATRALEIIASTPQLVRRPLELARAFTSSAGLPAAQSAVVSWILGEPEAALEAGEALRAAGFLVVPIRPPTVPAGTSRLRFTFSAAHREEDVLRLAEAVADLRRHAVVTA